ncbi:MAG: helix-turn-helix domain-containing protein, partial [Acidithiobacillus sp.]|nr:helix-turn-helix domain-containing protein [Acidithiobacillus sp.]
RCLLDIRDPDTESEEEEGTDMGLLDYSARREEREQIVDALEKAHWRRSEAAEMLGWSRKTLWLKMKKYNLSE